MDDKAKSTRSPRRNREAEVMEAAIEVFFDRGYAGASIQDVADRVGVLKGSLYHYIASKEDLLFRILDESHRQATQIIEETRALEASPLQRIAIYFESYLLWYLTNLERVSVYFGEWRHLTGERHQTVRLQRHTYERFVRDMIVEAQRAGDVSADISPKYASFFLLGAVNAVPRWYRRDGEDSPEQIARVFAGLVLNTITGEGGASLGLTPAAPRSDRAARRA